MKKILSIVLVALLVAGVALAATPGYRVSPGTGEIKHNGGGMQYDPGKTFRMVRYVPTSGTADSATLASGSIVVWDTVSDDGVTITTTTTSYDTTVAGIIVQNALTPDTLGKSVSDDAGKRNWTWLQTHGLSTVRIQSDSTEVDAGDAMSCGDDAGEATDFIGGGTDANTQGMAGFFFDDATAGQNNVECFVMCE